MVIDQNFTQAMWDNYVWSVNTVTATLCMYSVNSVIVLSITYKQYSIPSLPNQTTWSNLQKIKNIRNLQMIIVDSKTLVSTTSEFLKPQMYSTAPKVACKTSI